MSKKKGVVEDDNGDHGGPGYLGEPLMSQQYGKYSLNHVQVNNL